MFEIYLFVDSTIPGIQAREKPRICYGVILGNGFPRAALKKG